jgi:ADP-heptose:LPS heptosyltransferase
LLVRADYEFFKETGAYPTASEFPGDDVFLSFCLLSNYGKRHRVLTLPHQDLPAPHALSASKNYLRTRNAIVKKCRKFFFGPELGKLADIEAIPFSENDSTTAPSERVAQSLGTPLVPGMTTHTGTPRRLILVSKLSPGDILMLTAAVRDLHLSHPGKFITDVETSVPQLWENNPNITKLSKEDHGVEVVEAHYPLIHQCNEGPYHFIHGYRLDLEQRLGVKITPTKFWADVHFSKEELTWMSMIHQHFTEWDSPFWIICVGGKKDYTAKWWIQEYAQEVVDYFRDRIQFVQIGAEGDNHFHPPLKGVINLIGRTDLRQLMRLVYHASGVICPVTFVMHLAAAVPPKPGLPRRKPCVVTAGGREPSVWEAYTNHIFLHANGQMRCCENGGCWKSRILPLDDGDEKDRNVCLNPVEFNGRKVQACMRDLVKPADVIRAVEKYYAGGILQSPPPGFKTIDATWEDRISK